MEKREFRQTSRTGKTRVWTIAVDGARITTTYGESGGKMQEVIDVGQAKNVGKSNAVTPAEDALYLAGRQILDKTRNGYTEEGTEAATAIDWNSTLPINLRFYKPDNTLSAALEKKLEARDAWLSRKRDGEMVVVVKGPDERVDVYSRRMLRSHHLEVGMYEWRDRLQALVRGIEERGDIPPCTILLGDLVMDSQEDRRWEVASYMKSLTQEVADKQEPYFYCWDIAFWNGADLVSTTSLAARYERIWWMLGRSTDPEDGFRPGSRVVPVEVWEVEQVRRLSYKAGSFEAGVERTAAEYAIKFAKDAEWEGWVVVDPTGVYGDKAYNFRGKTDRPGRYCGKLKPSYELDAILVFDPDHTVGDPLFTGLKHRGKWGNGNNRGQVGAVSLYQFNKAGELVYLCDCGSGIDDAFRAAYSDTRRYPIVATIEYTERTLISEGEKTNALTFPRLLCVRDDKLPEECIEERL